MIGDMRSRLLIPMAVLLAAVGCGGNQQPSPAAPIPERSAPKSPGNEIPPSPRRNSAPDFTITTFTGDRFSLAEQRGTPVVLNFWESW